jgi:hypothetical protein
MAAVVKATVQNEEGGPFAGLFSFAVTVGKKGKDLNIFEIGQAIKDSDPSLVVFDLRSEKDFDQDLSDMITVVKRAYPTRIDVTMSTPLAYLRTGAALRIHLDPGERCPIAGEEYVLHAEVEKGEIAEPVFQFKVNGGFFFVVPPKDPNLVVDFLKSSRRPWRILPGPKTLYRKEVKL